MLYTQYSPEFLAGFAGLGEPTDIDFVKMYRKDQWLKMVAEAKEEAKRLKSEEANKEWIEKQVAALVAKGFTDIILTIHADGTYETNPSSIFSVTPIVTSTRKRILREPPVTDEEGKQVLHDITLCGKTYKNRKWPQEVYDLALKTFNNKPRARTLTGAFDYVQSLEQEKGIYKDVSIWCGFAGTGRGVRPGGGE